MKKLINLQSLRKELDDFDFYLLTNPKNLELLKKTINSFDTNSYGSFHAPFGIEIKVDSHLPQFAMRWEFPEDKFIEYEPERDESWCRFFKIGREVSTGEPLFYKVSKGFRIYNDMFSYIMRMPTSIMVTNIS
jgi:hypothetical protein